MGARRLLWNLQTSLITALSIIVSLNAQSTTKVPCPQAVRNVVLTPSVDNSGKGQLTCSPTQAVPADVAVRYTFSIEGSNYFWTKVIEASDKLPTISVSEIPFSILNKKITCTVEVKYLVRGAEWCNSVDSNAVEPSIKCPQKNRVMTVVEGGDEQLFYVQLTVPPSLLCRGNDSDQCKVEVTTTFTSVSNELRCSKTEIIPQAVLAVTTVGQGTYLSCGIPITKDNWQNVVKIPVKGTVEGIIDGDQTRKLKISVRIVGQVSKITDIEECGEYDVKVLDKEEGATCTSINDPHMKTFDNIRYDNFIPGEFVLYKHKTLPYEVRALYRYCHLHEPGRPTCNCGVAVRVGDDVITFDTCNTRQNMIPGAESVITVDLYKNAELTPGTKVLRFGYGQKYEVHLPTGTVITMTGSYKPFMNINILASSYDFLGTEGLCASYNKIPSDDFEGLPTTNDFSRRWLRTTTIFQGVGASATTGQTQKTYCSCQSGQQPICAKGLDVYKCRGGSGIDITDVLITQAKKPVLTGHTEFPVVVVKRAADDATNTGRNFKLSQESINTCKNTLEKSKSVQACLKHLRPGALNESIHNCALDLDSLNDTEWINSHIDDLIQECIISAEADVNAYNNNENGDKPKIPEAIISALCTVPCVNGYCDRGTCKCNNGWTGKKCDIGFKTTVPTVLEATNICDTLESTSACREIAIDGNNFVQTEFLTCKIKYITKLSTNAIETGEEYTVAARFISMAQIACPQNIGSDKKGRSSIITISNDGVSYSSSSYVHLVHKSTCQTCTLSTELSNITCNWNDDSCVIDNECYVRYEWHQNSSCIWCDPDVTTKHWSSKSDPNCPIIQKFEASDDKTTIIALGVLCGVLALAIVIILIVVLTRSNRNKKLQIVDAKEGSSHICPTKNVYMSGKDQADPECRVNPTFSN